MTIDRRGFLKRGFILAGLSNLFVTGSRALAKDLKPAKTTVIPDWNCSCFGTSPKELFELSLDDFTTVLLRRIIDYSGLEPNFEFKSANVANASAGLIRGKRFVFYNEEKIKEIRKYPNSYWAIMGSGAHEIGHHLQGHTIARGTTELPAQLEVEADRYSGFILHQMGAKLYQAQASIRYLERRYGKVFGLDSKTHPSVTQRYQAVREGWLHAKGLKKVVHEW